MQETDDRLLKLAKQDNVSAVARPIDAGEEIRIDGRTVTVMQHLPVGFKVANRPIAVGEKIIKYGAPMGSATAPIVLGELVHMHNLKSDYLPTYLLDDGHDPFVKDD